METIKDKTLSILDHIQPEELELIENAIEIDGNLREEISDILDASNALWNHINLHRDRVEAKIVRGAILIDWYRRTEQGEMNLYPIIDILYKTEKRYQYAMLKN